MKTASALLTAISVVGVVLLTSCGVSEPNEKETVQYAPEVRSVWWLIEDKSNEPCPGPSATAVIAFFVYLEHPDECSDISSMKVIGPDGGCWSWDSLGAHQQWNEVYRRFELWNCAYPDPGECVTLGDHAIEVRQAGREPRLFPFRVFGRCDTTATEGHLYSYSSSLNPQILRPAYSCSCCVQGDIASVAFDADDPIVSDGCVWYYDSADSWIGTSQLFGYLGGVNSGGHNRYNLNISAVRSRLDHIRIALMAEPAGHQGGYRARSEALPYKECLVEWGQVRPH